MASSECLLSPSFTARDIIAPRLGAIPQATHMIDGLNRVLVWASGYRLTHEEEHTL